MAGQPKNHLSPDDIPNNHRVVRFGWLKGRKPHIQYTLYGGYLLGISYPLLKGSLGASTARVPPKGSSIFPIIQVIEWKKGLWMLNGPSSSHALNQTLQMPFVWSGGAGVCCGAAWISERFSFGASRQPLYVYVILIGGFKQSEKYVSKIKLKIKKEQWFATVTVKIDAEKFRFKSSGHSYLCFSWSLWQPRWEQLDWSPAEPLGSGTTGQLITRYLKRFWHQGGK